MHVFINIGSNIGNRRMNLSRAIAAIEKEFGYFELSHTVDTEPEGFDSDHRFLNVGMMFISDLEPVEILHKLQAIERSISPASHRNADGSYADREIDIDIIAIDEIKMESEELLLPHPRMDRRRFVLEPLAELAPGWRHPDSSLTASQLLANLSCETTGVLK